MEILGKARLLKGISRCSQQKVYFHSEINTGMEEVNVYKLFVKINRPFISKYETNELTHLLLCGGLETQEERREK